MNLEHQLSAADLAADYLPLETDDIPFAQADEDRVGPDEQCPACHENRIDWLANDDGMVTCQSCGAVYDLEPDRAEAPNA